MCSAMPETRVTLAVRLSPWMFDLAGVRVGPLVNRTIIRLGDTLGRVTAVVLAAVDARCMDADDKRLHAGANIRCPHCRRWHLVSHGHTEGTEYTLQMLYFTCRGLRFYAGQDGYPSRHPTRGTDCG